MLKVDQNKKTFKIINSGYNTVFKPEQLTLGLVVPIETYSSTPIPSMTDHIERIQSAEAFGFSAIWLRDVPFNVPSFGDAGQVFDPFVYLGALAVQTSRIALGIASIVLPLRHPAHVAKAAATADVLSDGRLILGIASGDRPEEYPALNIPFETRGELFRESYEYIRLMSNEKPCFESSFGQVSNGIDMLPKPSSGQLPLLVTGSSQQSPDWIAANGDGWMTYPRPVDQQAHMISEFRSRIEKCGTSDKPVMEPLYIDLAPDPDEPPKPIHLGLHLGINSLRDYLKSRKQIGVNHVALNLRFNKSNIEKTFQKLSNELLPEFRY
ncbi:MAG: N5,N10-methylene tetrahydromethanopterin reductase [Methyloligella sp.]|nr:MAG: N5,N10-methylene tetrahydromethanopterin reductase [Methyloligella sp.]